MQNTSAVRQVREFAALRSASQIARQNNDLAQLERNKPGHGAAELARQIVAANPEITKAAARRAADTVLKARLARPFYQAVCSGGVGLLGKQIPSRALGRTPKFVAPAATRLVAFKSAKIVKAFEAARFRHSRAWEGDFHISLGGNVRADQTTGTGWINYKRDGYRQGITSETVTLCVPADWSTRVQAAGLDNTAGMMTLNAELIAEAWGGIAVYRAVWIRQGRGVSLKGEGGCIALHRESGTVYHSIDLDPAKAARGLVRQLREQGLSPAERDERRAAQQATRAARKAEALSRLVERVGRYDLAEIEHVEVRRQDSLRAGNCEPGTDTFIERFFPNHDRDEAVTIGEMARAIGQVDAALLKGADLTLARQLAAACLVAIRRDKQARRSLQLA